MAFSITLKPKDGWPAEWKRIRRMLWIGAALLGLELFASYAGLIHEVTARYQTRAPLASFPAQSHWVELPTTPFLEVGRQPEGNLSVDHLLLAWQKAGMNARQAHLVLDRVNANLSPVIMGVEDAQTEQALIEKARAQVEELRTQWPQLEANLAQQLKEPANSDLTPYELGRGWSVVQQRLQSSGSYIGVLPPIEPVDDSYALAKDNLVTVVGSSGLRMLQLGIVDQGSWSLRSIAESLDEQNKQMQSLTGWKGRVLGMEGRIALSFRKPSQVQTAGTTSDSNPNYLQIEGEWWTLPHEWFHALDITLAREAFEYGGQGSLTSNIGLFRKVQDQAVVDAWQDAIEGVLTKETEWRKRRWSQALIDLDPYLLSSSEAMAFAFGEYATQHQGRRHNFQQYVMREQGWIPNSIETQRQARYWETLLARVRPIVMKQEVTPTLAQHEPNGTPGAR